MNVRKEPNEFQKWCLEHGYTAEQVGNLIGRSKHTVYHYFSGERSPSKKTIRLMVEKLGIDPKMFY